MAGFGAEIGNDLWDFSNSPGEEADEAKPERELISEIAKAVFEIVLDPPNASLVVLIWTVITTNCISIPYYYVLPLPHHCFHLLSLALLVLEQYWCWWCLWTHFWTCPFSALIIPPIFIAKIDIILSLATNIINSIILKSICKLV